jgi:hypothetical protein
MAGYFNQLYKSQINMDYSHRAQAISSRQGRCMGLQSRRACLVVWLDGPGSYLGNLVLGNLSESMQYPTFGCMYELSLAHAR